MRTLFCTLFLGLILIGAAGGFSKQKVDASAHAAASAEEPNRWRTKKPPCLTIPIGANGEPDVSSVPIRTMPVGTFPYINSVQFSAMRQVGAVLNTPDAKGKPHGQAYFAIGKELVFLSGRLGLYEFENVYQSVIPESSYGSGFEGDRETDLTDLGAFCVNVAVSVDAIKRANKVRNSKMEAWYYEAQRTYVLRTPNAVIWFGTFAPEKRMTTVLLRGEVSASQSGFRGFPFPPVCPAVHMPQTDSVTKRLIPPFDARADFADFQGVFVPLGLLTYQGLEIETPPKMLISASRLSFEGGDKTMLPISIEGNRINAIGRHSEAEIRIIDKNTVVWLPPQGTSVARWWRRQ